MPITSEFSLTCFADAARRRVDAALTGYTDLADGCPQDLREAMRYSLLAPGKRLRPMLVYLAAEACGGTAEAATPAACAVEMVHTYSLIHDDLPAMDDDDLRRGRPTCHKVYGEALAILAGDALLTLAFDVLASRVVPPTAAARCCAILAEAAGACNLVGGQADDIRGDLHAGGRAALESIHRRKTGAMIVASLRLGAVTAGADSVQLDALDRYGRCLGLAFQITDDLLDVRGQQDQMGKRVGKDAAMGKVTYPGLFGVDESRRMAEELVADACVALELLPDRAIGLTAVADYVLQRDR
jgi:geranylgeranyl diphosphate synthase type II